MTEFERKEECLMTYARAIFSFRKIKNVVKLMKPIEKFSPDVAPPFPEERLARFVFEQNITEKKRKENL